MAWRCRSRRRRHARILESRIPEFGSSRNPCDVTAQSLATRKSLGVCADALLGDPQYGVLVSPMTYGYAPSAKRPLVYNDLAKQHGKMACVVWQTEWQEGPGVVEANSASGWRCSVRCPRVSPPWRPGTGGPTNAPRGADRGRDPAAIVAEAEALIAAASGADPDRTRGQGRAGAVWRARGRASTWCRSADDAVDAAAGAWLSGRAESRIPRSAAQDRGRRDPPEPAHRGRSARRLCRGHGECRQGLAAAPTSTACWCSRWCRKASRWWSARATIRCSDR